MTEPEMDNRLEVWERRLSSGAVAVPYVLLAASTMLALLAGNQTSFDRLVTLCISLLAASWMMWMVTLHPSWSQRRELANLYIAGLLVFIAMLISRSLWFGLFAFTGYLHTWHFLSGAWRMVGVAITAALSATWLVGGLPQITLPAVISYLVFIAVIVALVSLFSYVGEVTADQNRQRKQVIAELAEKNQRLAAALEENAGLHAQVLAQAREAGILDERQRMAGEIHDTLAQNLAGIITQLEAAERSNPNPEQWQRHLVQARTLARESLTDARRAVQALRPEPLDNVPLPEAIGRLAQRWSEANSVELKFAITGQSQPLLAEIETTLLRVTQEALTNVADHAQATRVGLTLSYIDEVVLLDVRDDGVGFDPELIHSNGQEPREKGFGLRLMQQRLRRVAGTLVIESNPGEGTALYASVPAITAVREINHHE